jgi:hypothetical protein
MTKIKAIKEFMRLYPNYKDMEKRKQVISWIVFTSGLRDDEEITQKQFDAWATPSYFKK